MGYRPYAYSIYGILTTHDALTDIIPHRGCGHETDETKPYCAECGSSTWIQNEYCLLDEFDSFPKSGFGYFYKSPEDKEELFIGFLLGETDYNKDITVSKLPTEDMKKDILAFIDTNHLSYSENDIKNYLFVYHSY